MLEVLKFYDIDPGYCDYLRKIEPKVPVITYEHNNKFVCGIVLKIGSIPYYTPISSNVTQQRTCTQILDKHGNALSSIKFCFMIPAPLSVVTEKDFSDIDAIDRPYANLVRMEYDYCLRNESTIREKAGRVYRVGCNKQHFLNSNCCDFALLETAYNEYVETEPKIAADKLR